MLSILNNNSSLNVQYQMNKTSKALEQATQRISTGLRINSAKDDAAGLAIASTMEAQVRGMTVASRNVNEGISLVQTAEGAFGAATGILQKMRELAVTASTGTLSDTDRTNLDNDYQQLAAAYTDTFNKVSYNGKKILGADAGAFVLQIGANSGDTFTVTTTDARTLLATPGDLTDATKAGTALTAIDSALAGVSSSRTNYGATLNRLDFVADNLTTSITNTSDARSKIMDADFAQEISKLTSSQILQQAGTAMLAQANSNPRMLLSLLN